MQEVICHECGHKAKITPDSTLCPTCRADLVNQLSVWQISGYFHHLAGELAMEGELDSARQMVARGLAYRETSDLHLLAALFARQAGDHEEIRRHVAAISVDDILREEAEWLLRSHGTVATEQSVAPKRSAAPGSVASQAGAGRAATRRRFAGPLIAMVLAAIVLVVALSLARTLLLDDEEVAHSEQSTSSAQVAAATATIQPASAAESGATESDTVSESPAPAASASGANAPTSTPSPTPTPTVAPNLAQAAAEPIAQAGSATSLSGAAFDLAAYLSNSGADDIVADEVSALVRGDTLLLEGVITTADERSRLIEVVAGASGIEEVEASGLYLRPPMTYTVQAGDSLWSITASVYGNTEAMEAIFRLNRDIMTAPGDLSVGDILELPPVE